MTRRLVGAAALGAALLVVSCRRGARPADAVLAVPTARIGGFLKPESVRYDPDQDVFFAGSIVGVVAAKDNNGYISRLRPDGSIENQRFISGGANGVTLHSPRGLVIHGDTLWACDADAVRGFDRHSGAPLASIDFTALQPGFLNDITVGRDGALYVTDTGRQRIYRIARGVTTIAVTDDALGGPNGITWDEAGNRFLVVPYQRGQAILSWTPGGRVETVAASPGGAYDGIEIIGRDSILVSSQRDSSIQLFTAGAGHPILWLAGPPADIGWDARRRVLAVPYVSRDTVELFRLP